MPSKDELAASCLPFVRQLACRLARRLPPQVMVDDLISAGCEGWFDARERFDPSHGVEFEFYAKYRVRGAMLDYLRSIDPLGRDTRNVANAHADAHNELSQRLKRQPESEEMAEELGLTLEAYERQRQTLYSGKGTLSLDKLEGENDGGGVLPDPRSVEYDSGFDALLEQLDTARLVTRALKQLEASQPRHATVIRLYFFEDITQREIGELLEVTDSRVCQIMAEALPALRAIIQEMDGGETQADYTASPRSRKVAARAEGMSDIERAAFVAQIDTALVYLARMWQTGGEET